MNCYLKYNGFLGIVSFYNNELLFCTKSQIDGDYSNYFKNIFNKIYDKKQINAIKKRLKDNNSSLVFEVIDSVNDKHIIEYNEDKLVLLDEIYNSINYSKVDYEELKIFADKNKIEIKELVYVINNNKEFERIYNIISEEDYKYNNNYVEGFVVEDPNGYMFKYKTEYYKKWKVLRSKMEYALKNNIFNETDEFIKYLEGKYKDRNIDLDKINIVDERKEYLSR